MSTSSGSHDYGRFDVLAEEFAERYRRGERPSLQEYVDRLPEMAAEIREMFPALAEVEQVEGDARGEASPPPVAAPPLNRIGDYRIMREIGRGGMGVVYEAEQISLGRRVALKVLPGHVVGDRKSLERFRREAKAAARLHHTNIVPVYRGRPGGRCQLLRDAVDPGPGARTGHRRAGAASSAPSAARSTRSRRARMPRAAGDCHPDPGRRVGAHGKARAQKVGRIAPERPAPDRRAGIARRRRFRSDRIRHDRAVEPGRVLGSHAGGHDRGPPSGRVGRRWVELGDAAGRHARSRRSIRRAVGRRSSEAWRRSAARRRRGWPTPTQRRGPPRHQAVEPAAGHRGRRLDHRLRPGQGGGRRPDPRATSWGRCATWRRSGSAARGTPAPTSMRWG